MSTTPQTTLNPNPSSDPAPTAEAKRRSQWAGLEAEIMEKVVRPKMMAAIAALNNTEGVSAASLSRYFTANFAVPASTNTITAWLKALNIRVTTRAYVELPPQNPTQNELDRRLNEMLAARAANLQQSQTVGTLGSGPLNEAPMTFTGAEPLNAGTAAINPAFGLSLDPTPPDQQ